MLAFWSGLRELVEEMPFCPVSSLEKCEGYRVSKFSESSQLFAVPGSELGLSYQHDCRIASLVLVDFVGIPKF